jgi:hypothetical protein
MKFMEVSSMRQHVIHPRNHDLVMEIISFRVPKLTLLSFKKKKRKRKEETPL